MYYLSPASLEFSEGAEKGEFTFEKSLRRRFLKELTPPETKCFLTAKGPGHALRVDRFRDLYPFGMTLPRARPCSIAWIIRSRRKGLGI